MPVRAVVVPATPLLVPGAAGGARVLGAARDLVAAALDELLAGLAPGATGDLDLDLEVDLLVLAPAGRDGARGAGTTPSGRVRSGRLRPSLAGAGIDDRWLRVRWPSARGATPPGRGAAPSAQVPASVALLCLAEACGSRGATRLLGSVEVVEMPAEPVPADRELVRSRLRRADAVVVAGGEEPAVRTALEDVARHAGWTREVRSTLEEREHLPGRYDVTVWRAGGRG